MKATPRPRGADRRLQPQLGQPGRERPDRRRRRLPRSDGFRGRRPAPQGRRLAVAAPGRGGSTRRASDRCRSADSRPGARHALEECDFQPRTARAVRQVSPASNGNWMVDTMPPPEPGSFAQRLPLPEAWAGRYSRGAGRRQRRGRCGIRPCPALRRRRQIASRRHRAGAEGDRGRLRKWPLLKKAAQKLLFTLGRGLCAATPPAQGTKNFGAAFFHKK